MICALALGRKGSVGLPGKNTRVVRGHPLAWYPLRAAFKAPSVDRIYMSTDDPELMALARDMGGEVIERPDYLCTAAALGEDAYGHGYREIVARERARPELLVLLFCNAPTIKAETIEEGIRVLRENPDYDSAVTVSCYNMFSPVRARRINAEGLLEPFLPLDVFDDQFVVSCDRNCQGDVWFADVAVSVVRPRNLDNLEAGVPPQKWMGKRIYPLRQQAGCDVDEEWQIRQVEWWLERFNPNP